MFKKLQKVGKAFVLPIAILPAAGLLLGIGGSFTNEATLQAYPWLNQGWLQVILKVLKGAGEVIFGNLSLLLCIGFCVGLANKDKGTAALAGVVGYFVMTTTTQVMFSNIPMWNNIDVFKENVKGIDTGVVGSIAMGSLAVFLHNRYHNIKLPDFLGFFGGSRFVPIATSLSAILVGAIFYLIWPPFQLGIVYTGIGMQYLSYFGTFLYGFLMRLAGAFGLHHVIYPLFWWTALGGTATVNGAEVVGAQNIFFAQLADPNHVGLFTEGTKYFAGRFSTMMFGLPAAALAMYFCLPKENRKKNRGVYLSVALTSFLTGITEPIEYIFLFQAFPLYLIHCFLDGLSFLFADLLQIRIGNTFSGGLIDFMLFGILPGNDKTNWLWQLLMGPIWAVIYYFTFYYYIKFFKVPIQGSEVSEEETEAEASENKESKGDDELKENAIKIVEALGGKENIEDVDACITRLRVAVKDVSLVNDEAIKKIGATAVLKTKNGGIQAVFGAKAILYKNIIDDLLGTTS